MHLPNFQPLFFSHQYDRQTLKNRSRFARFRRRVATFGVMDLFPQTLHFHALVRFRYKHPAHNIRAVPA